MSFPLFLNWIVSSFLFLVAAVLLKLLSLSSVEFTVETSQPIVLYRQQKETNLLLF